VAVVPVVELILVTKWLVRLGVVVAVVLLYAVVDAVRLRVGLVIHLLLHQVKVIEVEMAALLPTIIKLELAEAVVPAQ
jgi:hypothetical protein